ncbi:MAG: DUF86 domain-containing protein [Defluviitaleaceae bacterium]|nr:DUF86 domain-containing protein [Defluviitaleaceae bacterium]
MRDKDRELLRGMLEFAHKVKRRMDDLTFESFLENDDIQEAILYALGQMGEKATHLSDSFIEEHPRDEWYGLIGLRNRLFHSYEDISMEVVYKASHEQIDGLIEMIGDLLG